jgi:ABC-2 type transport system ATP-binding protein
LLQGNPLILDRHPVEAASLQLYVDQGDEALAPLLRILGQGGNPPKTVHLSRPSLDDVFLKLTGRSLRESGPG